MLYMVATPIGNLADMTFRAVEVLKAVDKIYCEDTRRTSKLLAHFDIKKSLDSFHHHSDYKIGKIIGELKDEQDIAYVSDAGTPGIQDPGGKLVAAAREAGVTVVPIPGASAVTALLSVSGIPTDAFHFMGYVPTKKGRQTCIKAIVNSDQAVVIFETAPRLLKLFNQLVEFGGKDITVVVGRELTKQFEEIIAGKPEELVEHFIKNPPKGELVLVLKKH